MVSVLDSPGRDVIERVLVGNEPVVLRGCIEKWPAARWTPASVCRTLSSVTTSFRIHERVRRGLTVWEGDCDYVTATFEQFFEWLALDRAETGSKSAGTGSAGRGAKTGAESAGALAPSNPFNKYMPRRRYWAYADYKHVEILLAGDEARLGAMRRAVDWHGTFGRGEGDGSTGSTLWMNSAGASTPCHQDTYGDNLVAQVYGRKAWTLFPPADTQCLYPVRVPYEESSVFAGVCVGKPDLVSHPAFVKARPRKVTLEAGDVLFVPRHWWHFVEGVSDAIAINLWTPTPHDTAQRVNEAVVRATVTAVHGMAARASRGDWAATHDSSNDEAPRSGSGSKPGAGAGAGSGGGSGDATDARPSPSPLLRAWVNPTDSLWSPGETVAGLQAAAVGVHGDAAGSLPASALTKLLANCLTHPDVVERVSSLFVEGLGRELTAKRKGGKQRGRALKRPRPS